MKKFEIFAGLGGGFGGATSHGTHECKNKDAAEELAYELALEDYESYDGLHGLRTVEDIIEQDEVSEDEAYEIWQEEREGWLDYYVEEIEEE